MKEDASLTGLPLLPSQEDDACGLKGQDGEGESLSSGQREPLQNRYGEKGREGAKNGDWQGGLTVPQLLGGWGRTRHRSEPAAEHA